MTALVGLVVLASLAQANAGVVLPACRATHSIAVSFEGGDEHLRAAFLEDLQADVLFVEFELCAGRAPIELRCTWSPRWATVTVRARGSERQRALSREVGDVPLALAVLAGELVRQRLGDDQPEPVALEAPAKVRAELMLGGWGALSGSLQPFAGPALSARLSWGAWGLHLGVGAALTPWVQSTSGVVRSLGWLADVRALRTLVEGTSWALRAEAGARVGALRGEGHVTVWAPLVTLHAGLSASVQVGHAALSGGVLAGENVVGVTWLDSGLQVSGWRGPEGVVWLGVGYVW